MSRINSGPSLPFNHLGRCCIFGVWWITICLLVLAPKVFGQIRPRPHQWAQPLIGSTLTNLYQVSDRLYRSEQPDVSEFKALYAFGIREVLNLRHYHSDKDETDGVALVLHRVKMNARNFSQKEIVAALRTIRKAKGPILVHCQHGADRTGVVMAMYRMVFQNWTRQQALDEMINGGYGFHKILINIPAFIKTADTAAIKAAVMAP